MLMSLLRCPPQWLYTYFYQPEGRYPAEPVQRVPAESRVLHSSCELFSFLICVTYCAFTARSADKSQLAQSGGFLFHMKSVVL